VKRTYTSKLSNMRGVPRKTPALVSAGAEIIKLNFAEEY
jgi:hypothetical protein